MKNVRSGHEKYPVFSRSEPHLKSSLQYAAPINDYTVNGYAGFDPGGTLIMTPDNRQEFLTIQESDQSGHRD